MEDDFLDEPDNCMYTACPLIRSDSAHKAHMEAPSIEKTQKRIRTVEGISNQVIEDVDTILDKCGQSHYVMMTMSELAIELAKALKGDRQTITVDTVRQSNWHNTDDFKSIDAAHILNTILSRDLPPERFGAIINLILATNLRASTEEEIEDSLRYLYGSGSYAEIANIPPLPENDLIGEGLNNAEVNEITMDKLKSLVELRPQVIDDFSAIFEKFPHTNIVSELLYSLMTELAKDLHGNTAKIDANSLKEYINEGSDSSSSNTLQSIFSTRLPAEVYSGLIEFIDIFSSNTSIEDIDKALEYLYGPKDDASDQE